MQRTVHAVAWLVLLCGARLLLGASHALAGGHAPAAAGLFSAGMLLVVWGGVTVFLVQGA